MRDRIAFAIGAIGMAGVSVLAVGMSAWIGIENWFKHDPYANETDDEWADRQW